MYQVWELVLKKLEVDVKGEAVVLLLKELVVRLLRHGLVVDFELSIRWLQYMFAWLTNCSSVLRVVLNREPYVPRPILVSGRPNSVLFCTRCSTLQLFLLLMVLPMLLFFRFFQCSIDMVDSSLANLSGYVW